MFNLYPKNVPNIERIMRIVFGFFLITIAFVGQPLFGLPSSLWIGVLLFTALFVIMTGFYGWCPACAMIGRKIKSQQPTEN